MRRLMRPLLLPLIVHALKSTDIKSVAPVQRAAAELRGDREIVLKAARGDGMTFEYAMSELRREPEVVLAAALQNRLLCSTHRRTCDGIQGSCWQL